jgi:hypothetical protein
MRSMSTTVTKTRASGRPAAISWTSMGSLLTTSSSLSPVTCTNCGWFQLPGVNMTCHGWMRTREVSVLPTETSTGAVGAAARRSERIAVLPSPTPMAVAPGMMACTAGSAMTSTSTPISRSPAPSWTSPSATPKRSATRVSASEKIAMPCGFDDRSVAVTGVAVPASRRSRRQLPPSSSA